ncbi:putative transposase-like protein [Klebsiella pneumoniae]|nr:putative transposase-like protein [Klebsiella pneumoniae]
MRLASRFGLTHSIRQERPLTNDELVKVVPSVFSEEKHNSRSDRYTYIPTITLLDKLREEGFQPFFACQSRVRDEDKRGHTKHMVRLRREGANKGTEVPEIILLNSHDGSSSYQMIPGMFRFVCTNGLVCGTSFGEIRVPHKGDIVGRVIEGAYEVLGIFDKITEGVDVIGFAPIFPDTCYHLTHYWPAAADIPVASDNPAHYADAIRYNARTPLQGSLLPLTRLVWA